MRFPKVTLEKPIPISPTISLDRERCILCYRCTRFSESVSEDGQLVARNRGAMSVITTFDDEPYTGPFTGNVTELCPVGALLPTQYRFEARPWEITTVPTVCGMCPVGCNTTVDMREGKAKRIRSRNHPEIDEGWICDKGRFGFTHLRATDRIVDPIQRVRRRGFEPVSWEAALDEAERLLRAATAGSVVVALSGSETIEQAYALAKLVRQGTGSHEAMLPEEVTSALDAYRLPLSAIAEAQAVAVLGDVPLAESAPIVDLWVRKARRNGATVVTDAGELGDADRIVLIWSGPGGRGGATVAQLAETLGLAGREGCGAFYVPATPNGRGIADAWAAASDDEPVETESVGLLIVSGDEAAGDPNVRALAERADAVIAISMFHGLAVGWADLVLPGTSYLEREGTYVNLEGRLQRLRRTAIAARTGRARVARAARLALRRASSRRTRRASSPRSPSAATPAFPSARSASAHRSAATTARLRTSTRSRCRSRASRGSGLQLVCYKPLFSGPAVERVSELQFQRPRAEVELSAADAERRGIATGDDVTLTGGGATVTRARRASTASCARASRASRASSRATFAAPSTSRRPR